MALFLEPIVTSPVVFTTEPPAKPKRIPPPTLVAEVAITVLPAPLLRFNVVPLLIQTVSPPAVVFVPSIKLSTRVDVELKVAVPPK